MHLYCKLYTVPGPVAVCNHSNPSKVLNCVPLLEDIELRSRASTPDYCFPLESPNLTSSPNDTPIMQEAVSEIKQFWIGILQPNYPIPATMRSSDQFFPVYVNLYYPHIFGASGEGILSLL